MNKVFVTKQHETISLKAVRDSLVLYKSFSLEKQIETVKNSLDYLEETKGEKKTDTEYITELFLRIIKIYKL